MEIPPPKIWEVAGYRVRLSDTPNKPLLLWIESLHSWISAPAAIESGLVLLPKPKPTTSEPALTRQERITKCRLLQPNAFKAQLTETLANELK